MPSPTTSVKTKMFLRKPATVFIFFAYLVCFAVGSNSFSQVHNYLKATGYKLGLLMNYNQWAKLENENPYLISDFSEVKTTWHPIEVVGPSGSGC